MYGSILKENKPNQINKFGKMKIFKNDVLVLEIDKLGILKKKRIL